MHDKAHLTRVGLEQIRLIKLSMNKVNLELDD